ncbi:MAG: fluoride efflux transporter CrcB, partial [Phycisphaerae bacterium]
QRIGGGVFPLGTLTVNVCGCLLIGVLSAFFAGPQLVREEYRVALLVGLLGGLTTFSSFGWETTALINDGQLVRAGLNVLLNNGAGLAAVWLGYRLTEGWVGAA